MRKRLQPAVTGVLTSQGLRRLRRGLAAAPRVLGRRRVRVDYFHDAGDPYSHLAAQILKALGRAFEIDLGVHLVAPPAADAAPDAARLAAYGRQDAAVLARAHDLDFPDAAVPDLNPTHEAPIQEASIQEAMHARHASILAAALRNGQFAAVAPIAGAAYWRGDVAGLVQAAAVCGMADATTVEAAIAAGTALRRKRGHYLGATFHCEGEWYWGLDRLPYLTQRLAGMGLTAGEGEAGRGLPRFLVEAESGAGGATGPTSGRLRIDFYASLRSPYTYLAAARARRLAERYGAELRIRFVLPMVMRGLPVPAAKRLYIVLDTKREAERLGLPFGSICDPVGAGAERGLAVLARAIALGRGPAFLESFLAGVFAEGIDAASDGGLGLLAKRAGVADADVAAALADDGWRATAEANRRDLLALGLWGVPSFQVDDRPAHWGQDRLWAVERELRG